MSDFQRNLQKYAELAVQVGVNVQKGQTLVVNATLDGAELVRLIVKKAYEIGAKDVVVNWADDAVSRTKYDLAPDETFTVYPEWRAKETGGLGRKRCRLYVRYCLKPGFIKRRESRADCKLPKSCRQGVSKLP